MCLYHKATQNTQGETNMNNNEFFESVSEDFFVGACLLFLVTGVEHFFSYEEVKMLYLSTAVFLLLSSFLPRFLNKFQIKDYTNYNLKQIAWVVCIIFIFLAATGYFISCNLYVKATFNSYHLNAEHFYLAYIFYVIITLAILTSSKYIFSILNKYL